MPRAVMVFSRRGCHLCENVVAALRSLASRYDLEVRVVDIDEDRGLHDRYWLTIPVVQVDGRDVFDARDMRPGVDCGAALERLVKDPAMNRP